MPNPIPELQKAIADARAEEATSLSQREIECRAVLREMINTTRDRNERETLIVLAAYHDEGITIRELCGIAASLIVAGQRHATPRGWDSVGTDTD